MKRSPPLAIYVYDYEYYIKKRCDKKLISDKEKIPDEKLWGGKIAPDIGKWIDWIFHVKCSYGEDGFTGVWKNGRRIVSNRGPKADTRAGCCI